MKALESGKSLEHEAYDCKVDEGRGAGFGLLVIVHRRRLGISPPSLHRSPHLLAHDLTPIRNIGYR
jgi:hypothetical protein